MTEPMPWVTGKTRLFGVIAHPADHVRAPMVFNPLFADRGWITSWCLSMRRQPIWQP